MLCSAFPGTGKSYFCENTNKIALDSDSSKFNKTHFPENYIEHIKNNIGNADYIFISSHLDVRNALVENDLRFVLIYPDKSLKNEYIERYKKRGSPDSFIKLLDNNWGEWISQLENQKSCDRITLRKGEYISDVLTL